MKTIARNEYSPNPRTDFTATDLYLLGSMKEQPNEVAKSRSLFKALTGGIPHPTTAEETLDGLVADGNFEKFKVRMGWAEETVWRSLNTSVEENVEPEPTPETEVTAEFIKLKVFVDYLLSSHAELNRSKSEDDFFGKVIWLAGHRITEGFNKASRKANHEIRTDVLENLLIETIKSTRGLDKAEWLGKVDLVLEDFNGQ